jgi:hypothetical protein
MLSPTSRVIDFSLNNWPDWSTARLAARTAAPIMITNVAAPANMMTDLRIVRYFTVLF